MSNGDTDPNDPVVCCLLGICCSPAEQFAALTAEFQRMGFSEEQAAAGALWAQKTFSEKKYKAAIKARDNKKS